MHTRKILRSLLKLCFNLRWLILWCIYVISFVSTICLKGSLWASYAHWCQFFTRHNRPNCSRGNVAMLCGPSQGWRDFHPRRSTSDFHSNQRVQLRGRKNFLVFVRVINLGYHIMHIHKYSPEYLGYLIGMVRLEVIPLVAGVCAGFLAHTLIAKANQKFIYMLLWTSSLSDFVNID